MWDLPRPEIKTMSPTLAGGFFNTATMEALICFFFFFFNLNRIISYVVGQCPNFLTSMSCEYAMISLFLY